MKLPFGPRPDSTTPKPPAPRPMRACPLRADLRETPLVDNEVTMARAAWRAGAAIAVPLVGMAALARGSAGALTAGIVVAYVLGTFVASGHGLAWAARRGLATYGAVAVTATFVRLGLFTALLAVLVPTGVLDSAVLAATLPVAILGLLTFEVLFVLRQPQLWHVNAAATTDDLSTHSSKDCA